jgi:hypothetical protein
VWLVHAAGLATLAILGILGILGILEDRRQHAEVAPLLRTQLLRIPAFSAGLFVQLAFAAGLQGFFLTFALWLQTGRGFSPIGAGLTTVAFSVGSFALAGGAVPLAQRYGRLVLSSGAVLLVVGTLGAAIGAGHVGIGSDPWPVMSGLVVAGVGLSRWSSHAPMSCSRRAE